MNIAIPILTGACIGWFFGLDGIAGALLMGLSIILTNRPHERASARHR
jgi:hypothetical protein